MMGAGYAGKRAMANGRDDWFYRRCVGWELTVAWLPKRCDLTGRRIWLKEAWRGTSVLTGPGESIIEHRWHDKDEHLIFLLKGKNYESVQYI